MEEEMQPIGNRTSGGLYSPASPSPAPSNSTTSTLSDAEGLGCCDPCENPVALGGGLCCTLVVALLALISLGSVEPLHYGIRYNSFTKAARTESIYKPGRYLIGPFNKFLIFPSTVQTIEFTNIGRIRHEGERNPPLSTRSKDALPIELQLSLQYRLNESTLGDLYSTVGINYQTVFVSVIRDALLEEASKYEATHFWEEREAFGLRMEQVANEQLVSKHSECWGLQLLKIDLPDNFEDSLTRTQVQQQLALQRRQEQASAAIKAETLVIESDYNRQVKAIVAGGEANYTLATMKAQAEAQKKRIEVESSAMDMLTNKLQLSGEGLVLYQRYGAMDLQEGADLYFGFGGGAQVYMPK